MKRGRAELEHLLDHEKVLAELLQFQNHAAACQTTIRSTKAPIPLTYLGDSEACILAKLFAGIMTSDDFADWKKKSQHRLRIISHS